MRDRILIVLMCVASIGSACLKKPPPAPVNSAKATPEPTSPTSSPTPETTPLDTAGRTANAACRATKLTGEAIDPKQTFAIDIAPFHASCFVTAHDPEYSDPPLDSHFAIYKKEKKVFEFPDQFNGVTNGCWVEAVSFQDLNSDNLTDIVIVGKCNARAAAYNENMVYVNSGKDFTTRIDANYQIDDKKTVKDIVDFVSENSSMFF